VLDKDAPRFPRQASKEKPPAFCSPHNLNVHVFDVPLISRASSQRTVLFSTEERRLVFRCDVPTKVLRLVVAGFAMDACEPDLVSPGLEASVTLGGRGLAMDILEPEPRAKETVPG